MGNGHKRTANTDRPLLFVEVLRISDIFLALYCVFTDFRVHPIYQTTFDQISVGRRDIIKGKLFQWSPIKQCLDPG